MISGEKNRVRCILIMSRHLKRIEIKKDDHGPVQRISVNHWTTGPTMIGKCFFHYGMNFTIYLILLHYVKCLISIDHMQGCTKEVAHITGNGRGNTKT